MTTDEAGSGILRVSADGPLLAVAQDALDLIGDAWGAGASTIVVPVARLDPSFFDLTSGLLGEVTQKFVNYRIRLVVLGDLSEQVAASNAFRDYVREVNTGAEVWFVADEAELASRLAVVA